MSAVLSIENFSTAISVSALNQAASRLLERSFPLVWVAGEVSNFTQAVSGHWYFTLKDEAAQVRAVVFRARAKACPFLPRNGDKIEVRALVTLYVARGEYQLGVEAIRRAGMGNLHEAFLQLKAKLAAAGLFESERKKPLPSFIKTIGIISSEKGAALQDVLITLSRRAQYVRIILYPVPVQGDGAAQKIAAAIRQANQRAECQLLLLCRGGGSAEDLWAFNEEDMAFAIADSILPVVTGIGHETDFTIADFVADVRAATPTAAAEMAVTPQQVWQDRIMEFQRNFQRALQRTLVDYGQTLDRNRRALLSGQQFIFSRKHRKLQNFQLQFMRLTAAPFGQMRFQIIQLRSRLARQLTQSASSRALLSTLTQRFKNRIAVEMERQRQTLLHCNAKLELLNPQTDTKPGLRSDHHAAQTRNLTHSSCVASTRSSAHQPRAG